MGIVAMSHHETIYGENLVLEQYTGLKDEIGINIFEGDIVRVTDLDGGYSRVDSVVWGNDGNPEFDLKGAPYFEPNTLSDIVSSGSVTIEVIGNIHENPESLEGEQ